MNSWDIMRALCGVSEEIIAERFADEPEEISKEPRRTMIQMHEPEGDLIREAQSSCKKKGSSFLAYLLTAGCTAACIAGFAVLIRMTHANTGEYLQSDVPGAAITEITQTSVAVTAAESTAHSKNTALATPEIITQTEIPVGLQTTAETILTSISETTAESVTEPVSASVDAVTETTAEITVVQTEAVVQKPQPADDLDERVSRLADLQFNYFKIERTVFDEMKGDQFGEQTWKDVLLGFVVYAEDASALDRMIELNTVLCGVGIERTECPEYGESCWMLKVRPKTIPGLAVYKEYGGWFEADEARCLYRNIKEKQCGEILDIVFGDVTRALCFAADTEYCIQILQPLEDFDFPEAYAAYLDTEKSRQDSQEVVLYPKNHDAMYDIICDLKERTDLYGLAMVKSEIRNGSDESEERHSDLFFRLDFFNNHKE